MKKYLLSLLVLFFLAENNFVYGQVTDSAHLESPVNNLNNKTYRVAIFAPLYLDSLFAGNKLRSETEIPNFAVAGIDFVQGAEMALDTILLNGKHVQAHIFDSKSLTHPVLSLFRDGSLDNMDLIIGSVKEPEFTYLAKFAQQRKVPFISATYPNEGSQRANPFLFIVNSTLKAHCEGIFSYILQKHGTDNIYLVTQKNDHRIQNYFREINWVDGKPMLKIRTLTVDTTIISSGLRYLVDTTKPMVIIGASLNQIFAKKLADACYPIQKTNQLTFIGMPNWDGFTSLYQPDAYTDFPIRYTTPHYEDKDSSFIKYLDSSYFYKYHIMPSDMAAKGFEITYYFTSILINHYQDFTQQINDTAYAVFHDFNFRPVYHEANESVPDYYENKHLFIMQILNGKTIREW